MRIRSFWDIGIDLCLIAGILCIAQAAQAEDIFPKFLGIFLVSLYCTNHYCTNHKHGKNK